MVFKTTSNNFKTGYLVHIQRVDTELGKLHEEDIVFEDLDDMCKHFSGMSLISLKEAMAKREISIFSVMIETADDIIAEVASFRQFRGPYL